MSLLIESLLNAVATHALSSGHFDGVYGHEVKSAPGTGLTFAVWVERIDPVRAASGSDATTARIELNGRIYKPFLSKPEDLIDPNLTNAADDLFEALSGDYTLGGIARNIDLLGAHGTPLSMRAGYDDLDKVKCRIFNITIPIIVNDAWTQEA